MSQDQIQAHLDAAAERLAEAENPHKAGADLNALIAIAHALLVIAARGETS
jgi:hypothetical protein